MSRAGGWSWRTFWVSLVVLSSLLGLWGLATPLFAVPDEPAHFLKAAGVARGQLTGPPGMPTAVDVPPALESTRLQTGCFVFQPDVPADCAPGFDGADGPDRRAFTQAGRYPPAYYALVGLPTLVWTDLESVYAVRGVSAALCAALLAAAVTAAASTGRRLLVLAVGAAVTPMTLFLGSAVNPSGPEIAAAVALWTAGLVLATGHGPPSRPVLAAAGAAAVVLALSRPISPFWVALIGVGLLLVAGRRRSLELVRVRAVRLWLAGIVLAAGLQAGWVVGVGALDLYGGGRPLALSERVAGSVARTDERLQQMVGWFGWLDTPAPVAVHLAWAAAVLAVLVLGLRGAVVPSRAVLLAVLALGTVLVPVALEVPAVADVGFYWQGRYTLPLAVGVPLLAAVAARARAVPRVVAYGLVAVLAVCQAVGYVVALGRYTVGTGNGLGLTDVVWSPPLPAPALALGLGLAVLAWSACLLRVPTAAGSAQVDAHVTQDADLPPVAALDDGRHGRR